MLLDPTNKFLTLSKLGTYFKFKMAAKTDHFRRIPISGIIWVKNISEIPVIGNNIHNSDTFKLVR